MLAHSPATITVDEVCALMIEDVDVRMRTTPLAWRPGARELLDECRARAIPTALVSASWARLIQTMRDHMAADLGFAAFDAVVAGDEVSEGKPHPEPYLRAAQALGTLPDTCLALEDSPTGVRSAVDAGCRVVAIPHIADIDVPGAHVVPTLAGWTLPRLWELTQG
jgi:HAD superfamily hydrolase (TIGR01509 family)